MRLLWRNWARRGGGRVAIVGGDGRSVPPISALSERERRGKFAQLRQLILGQRLGGKEIERAGRRVAQQAVEDGQVVAEGLAAGRRCDNGHVVAVQRMADCPGLVGVGLLDAAPGQGLAQRRMKRCRQGRKARVLRMQRAPRHDIRHKAVIAAQVAQKFVDGHDVGSRPYRSRWARQSEFRKWDARRPLMAFRVAQKLLAKERRSSG